jgi:hypothetical protein
MTGSRALLRVSVDTGRHLLPWMVVLLISMSLAYAATSAVTGSWASLDTPALSGAPGTSEPRASSAVADEVAIPRSRGSCPSYSGAYGWLLYDLAARGGACQLGANDDTASCVDKCKAISPFLIDECNRCRS